MAIERIAFYLDSNSDEPNIALAEELAASGQSAEIAEIAAHLNDADERIAGDCVKVLYELGARKPEMIVSYVDTCLALIDGKRTRMVWGAMTALAEIAELAPAKLFAKRASVVAAFAGKSVIAADEAVSVLAGLCRANDSYRAELFPILIDHLGTCRPKEIAQHAERTAVCVRPVDKAAFKEILEKRRADMSAPQAARIDKLLRRLEKNT